MNGHSATPLVMHPGRLLPTEPGLRRLARSIYETIAERPIFSPHGHVDAAVLADDEQFPDPTRLLISPDHYVTRVLHSVGVDLAEIGVGVSGRDMDPREAWRTFAAHWPAYLGTASRYWLEVEFSQIFGVDQQLSSATADDIYDQIAERLGLPAYRPRALFERFNISVLATTDDPCADLSAHRRLSEDATFSGNVIPTFRPDAYLDPGRGSEWAGAVARLGVTTGLDTGDYQRFLEALEQRRRYFIDHGATATDYGAPDTASQPLSSEEASALHRQGLARGLGEQEARAYRANMLFEMARMSVDDGLVMQFHPGVLRNHHRPTQLRFGDDTGHDVPLPTDYSRGLRPLLDVFGTDPRLRLVLFTVDETAFARDIAPLAGFYPSVYAGAPWWFLDAPDRILHYRSVLTEGAGFYKTAGFVDDTRAFCSIPARHDMSRRLDASYLARLVAEHRMGEDDAHQIISDLVSVIPQDVFTRTR
jgi:glucuronate isomerase